jgi:hypothetical protein
MKKSTVSRRHQRPAMQWFGNGQIVEKEIDAMHMNHIGVRHMLQHLGTQRISAGTVKRQAHHANAVDLRFRGKKFSGIPEQPVERNDFWNLIVMLALLFGDILDHIFHAAYGGRILTHDVHDFNRHI